MAGFVDLDTPASDRPELRIPPSPGRDFPGPMATGICLTAAPVIGVLGSALAIGIYHYQGTEMLRAMARHHARATAGFNLAAAAVVLMMFAVLSLAGAICDRHPVLGRAGGILTLVGLAGPLYFVGMYWGTSYLTAPGSQAAGAHVIDQTNVIPSTIVNVSGPALVAGFILLAVGAAGAGVLPRWRAVGLGATALLPVGFISGYIACSAVGFAAAGVALVPLGVGVLRHRGGVSAGG